MGIAIQCPGCGRRFRVKEELAGKQVACPCGRQFLVPAVTHDPLVAPLTEAPPPAAGSSSPTLDPSSVGPPRASLPMGLASAGGARSATSSKKRSRALWLSIAAGSVLLLAIMGIVVGFATRRPATQETRQQTITASEPAGASMTTPPPTAATTPQDGSSALPATTAGPQPAALAKDSGPAKPTELELEKRIQAFDISEDGQTLVAYRFEPNADELTGPTCETAIWDLPTGKKIKVIDNEHVLTKLMLSPNGAFFAAPLNGLRIWNARTGEVVRQFQPHGPTFNGSVDFSHDSRWVCYPVLFTLSVINIDTGQTLLTPVDRTSLVFSCRFSPVEFLHAVGRGGGGKNFELDIYNLQKSAAPLQILKLPIGADALAFSRDGKTLVVAQVKEGKIAVYETAKWTLQHQFTRVPPPNTQSMVQYEKVLASPDGSLVAILPMYTGRPKVELWDVKTGTMRQFGPEWCTDMKFLANGTLALATYKNGLQFFDPRTGAIVAPPAPVVVASLPTKKGDDLESLPPLERARAYRAKGMFAEAIAAYLPLVAAAEKEHGATHVKTLEWVRALAECQRGAGDFKVAVELYRRCFDATEAALQSGPAGASNDLLELAEALVLSADRAGAVDLLSKTRSSRHARLGPSHAAVGDAEYALGVIFGRLGDELASQAHFEKSLEIRRQALKPPHVDLARSLMRAGHSCSLLNQFDKAVPLLEEAVAMFEKAPGTSQPILAEAEMRLADTYVRMGDAANDRKFASKSLSRLEQSKNWENPEAVYVLRSLAARAAQVGEVNQAEATARKTLEIATRLYGPKHVILAEIYGEMARSYDYAELAQNALDYETRAIAALKALYGEEFPRRAQHVHILARANAKLLRSFVAEDLFRLIHKLGTQPTAEGKWTAVMAAFDFGRLLAVRQRPDEALAQYDQGVRALWALIREILPILPDTLKARNAASYGSSGSLPLSGVLHHKDKQTWLDHGAEWVINLKGLSEDVLADQALMLRDAEGADVKQLALELLDLRKQIAGLSIGGVEPEDVGELADQARKLLVREKELTAQLGRALPLREAAKSWVSLAQVRERLDPKSVLVEFVQFTEFDLGRYRSKGYPVVAFVVPPRGKGEVQLIELGESSALNAAIDKYHAELEATREDAMSDDRAAAVAAMARMDKATDALSALLSHKLQRAIAAYDRWLLGPDAALWLVPWGALRSPDGKYIVASKEVICVTSGRTLASDAPKHKPSSPVLIADVDYNLGLPAGTVGGAFSTLPAGAAEAAVVGPKLAKYAGLEPLVLTKEKATETALKAQRNPRVLFLSTHGYFEEYSWRKHPLLRSGLAFAGANASGLAGAAPATAGGDDGVLTALEVVSLDLRGTELVVLSACQTGLGQVSLGQGVAGLRQSFHLAGADSVIATLWSIPDSESADVMIHFFDGLANGKRKTESLRLAQLSMIEFLQGRRLPPHPAYWGAFVVSGRQN
jgi:CHAT domain-containing protein/tetratricopeptide (TPR) repeat protein